MTTNDLAPVRSLASGWLCVLGGLVVIVLIVFAGGYGYHRDELYFLAAGDHLAWSYPDQGPLIPLLAHVMDRIAPGSLTVLRIPSALMAGATVVVTGMIARELGGSRCPQLIAASCTAVASVVLVVGHLLSTSTFDLAAWALLTWLVARVVRTGQQQLWLLAGLITGLALLNKPLIVFLLAGLGLGLVIVGPRELLRGRLLWAGLGIALVMWAPWLIWQAEHGWPQLTISSAIAQGGSASSQPRWALLPFQFLLISPVLAPVWIVGLHALLRDPRLRRFRFFALTWLTLVVVFLTTGGKPYYLAGMFPVLLAAGALPTDAWLTWGSTRRRGTLLGGAIALSGLVSAIIALPILPAQDAGPVIAVNADAGETIGWPQFAGEVAAVYRRAPKGTVIFTSNYGEAGAIDRYGPALGLPTAYSGHNAFAEWGPPPDRPGAVILIAPQASQLNHRFKACRLARRVTNPARIHNQEHDATIELCAGPRGSWSQIWPHLRHLG